jgi:hypothetical protein
MNKVDLKYHTFSVEHKYCEELYNDRNLSASCSKLIDDFYLQEFGIQLNFHAHMSSPKDIHYFKNLPIIDESKFTLFILKFSHLIEKIVYE